MVSKHDKITNSLEQRLRKDFNFLQTNLEYKRKTNVIGEIDLIAYRNGIMWICETKTWDSPKLKSKMLNQIARAEKHYIPIFERQTGYKVNKLVWLYVYGVGDNNALNYKVECQGVTYFR